MSDKTFVYLIIGIVVAHFLFGIGYIIYKISKTPKSSKESDNFLEKKEENSL